MKKRSELIRTKRARPDFLLGFFLVLVSLTLGQDTTQTSLRSLVPELKGWSLTEPPATFLPGTLFEYIDGAAENYLSYGFRELIVGNYKKGKSTASLTVEVYDMGDDLRAYGVYSS